MIRAIAMAAVWVAFAFAQDTTAIVEGLVTDPSGATLSNAVVEALNPANGFTRKQPLQANGNYRLVLPAGTYEISIAAPGFTTYRVRSLAVNVSQSVRLDVQLQIAKEHDTVEVTAEPPLVETSNAIGNVVTGRELVDLPLNGRNFTQLGLLQPGVAPMTEGLAEAGGSLRAGQAYAVNGQRPESNNYLLDGVTNVNRVDGGYALKTPVDAIQEFRILTETAPAEYGGTSGATTTVVTRSGSNEFHGTLYEFLRNDALDARNFFASERRTAEAESVRRHVRRRRSAQQDFFFGYYEGFRNRAGRHARRHRAQRCAARRRLLGPERSANRPTRAADQLLHRPALSKQPDSRRGHDPLAALNLAAVLSACQRRAEPLRHHADPAKQHATRAGFASTTIFSERDQLFVHYTRAASSNMDPLSIAGANVPGFPVGEDIEHPQRRPVGNARVQRVDGQQRSRRLLPQRVRYRQAAEPHVAAELGFQLRQHAGRRPGPALSSSSAAMPASGDPITGPRDTTQNTFEFYDALSHITGRHSFKFGVDFRRNQINMTEGIASNGFFVFAPFPVSDSFASFLHGLPGRLLSGRRRHESRPAQHRFRRCTPRTNGASRRG